MTLEEGMRIFPVAVIPAGILMVIIWTIIHKRLEKKKAAVPIKFQRSDP